MYSHILHVKLIKQKQNKIFTSAFPLRGKTHWKSHSPRPFPFLYSKSSIRSLPVSYYLLPKPKGKKVLFQPLETINFISSITPKTSNAHILTTNANICDSDLALSFTALSTITSGDLSNLERRFCCLSSVSTEIKQSNCHPGNF